MPQRSEALDLVTLCAIIEGQTVLPMPAGWTKVFESPQISYFTEKWQLWQNASGSYGIVIRGTVPTDGSIVEDLISFLAQATGSARWGHRPLTTNSPNPHASVHVGRSSEKACMVCRISTLNINT